MAKQIAQQLPERQRKHQLTLLSAGVAFYAFLAFVPALDANRRRVRADRRASRHSE
jgi:uncharacterized BrkB/YihY/UPF0761 family membrane protein